MEFSFINRSLFNLDSIDLAEYSAFFQQPITVQFVGYYADGNTVTTNFTTDGIIDGTGPLADFQTFNFDKQWTGLSRVKIPGWGWSLDNLVLSVPNPNDSVVGWGSQFTVPPTLTSAVAVSAGGNQGGALNVALRPDGTVISWGGNYYGQTNVPPGLSNIVAVAAGVEHCLALFSDGTVTGWGSSLCSSALTNSPPGLTDVVAIAAGNSFNLALTSDGTVVQWPTNEVPAGLHDVVAISAGVNHSLALKSDGTAIGWGNNWYGVTNVPPGATNLVAIAAGYRHNLALRSDGTVLAWGANFSGQTNVPPDLANAIAIAAGWDTSIALRRDGTVVAWGDNSSGKTNVPAGLSNVVAISAGFAQCLALVGASPPALLVPASHPAIADGRFELTVPSQSGRVYRLEYLDSLTDPEWTPLPLVAGNLSHLVLTDQWATNSQRFYRVRRW